MPLHTRHAPASLYRSLPGDPASRIAECIQLSNARRPTRTPASVFFRADDIGAPGRSFNRLMRLFGRYRAPLCLAVVPAWLTLRRWEALMEACPQNTSSLWCWHQHGWRHQNHEIQDKKQEFGPSRTQAAIQNDILRGRRRLEAIMGPLFFPLFTPPWNRCSPETLDALKKLNFRAVSRFRGARPETPSGLLDIPVHLDLHTRKERSARDAWRNLFRELEAALDHGVCGVMIHHQRMNDAAFMFLEVLLDQLQRIDGCRIVDVREMGRPVMGDGSK